MNVKSWVIPWCLSSKMTKTSCFAMNLLFASIKNELTTPNSVFLMLTFSDIYHSYLFSENMIMQGWKSRHGCSGSVKNIRIKKKKTRVVRKNRDLYRWAVCSYATLCDDQTLDYRTNPWSYALNSYTSCCDVPAGYYVIYVIYPAWIYSSAFIFHSSHWVINLLILRIKSIRSLWGFMLKKMCCMLWDGPFQDLAVDTISILFIG